MTTPLWPWLVLRKPLFVLLWPSSSPPPHRFGLLCVFHRHRAAADRILILANKPDSRKMQRAKRDGRGSLGFAAEIIFHIMLTFAGQLSASFGGGWNGAAVIFSLEEIWTL